MLNAITFKITFTKIDNNGLHFINHTHLSIYLLLNKNTLLFYILYIEGMLLSLFYVRIFLVQHLTLNSKILRHQSIIQKLC